MFFCAEKLKIKIRIEDSYKVNDERTTEKKSLPQYCFYFVNTCSEIVYLKSYKENITGKR